MVSKLQVSDICISDHCPVVCTWSSKTARKLTKGHRTIKYRSFKHFIQDDFLQDLSSAVFGVSDPNKAWYEAFLPVTEKHAPLRRKRVEPLHSPSGCPPILLKQ